jgi:hypothetical protein
VASSRCVSADRLDEPSTLAQLRKHDLQKQPDLLRERLPDQIGKCGVLRCATQGRQSGTLQRP